MSTHKTLLADMRAEHWAILPDVLSSMVDALDSPQAATIAALRPAGRATKGTLAVIPVYGVIRHRAGGLFEELFGGTSLQQFTRTFQALVDDDTTKAIVLDIDSPGGTVSGLPEAADVIYRAKGRKPIIAVANSLCASAAYWLASQCDEVIASPSATVGSIGVIVLHEEISRMAEKLGVKVTVLSSGKYKGEANRYEPLSDEAKAHAQSVIDAAYAQFVNAVARGRRTNSTAVRNGYAQGRVVGGVEAVRLKLADRVDTLDETIARLRGGALSASRAPGALTYKQRLAFHQAMDLAPVRTPQKFTMEQRKRRFAFEKVSR